MANERFVCKWRAKLRNGSIVTILENKKGELFTSHTIGAYSVPCRLGPYSTRKLEDVVHTIKTTMELNGVGEYVS